MSSLSAPVHRNSSLHNSHNTLSAFLCCLQHALHCICSLRVEHEKYLHFPELTVPFIACPRVALLCSQSINMVLPLCHTMFQSNWRHISRQPKSLTVSYKSLKLGWTENPYNRQSSAIADGSRWHGRRVGHAARVQSPWYWEGDVQICNPQLALL